MVLYAAFAEQHPGRAARMATALLASSEERDLERGREVAAALRGADRCAVCGRGLSNPLSMARGIGPECWGKTDAAERAYGALVAAGLVGDACPYDPDGQHFVGCGCDR